jgi:CheY-like chemotaxis protein
MVEDDAKDVELTLTALEEYNLANEVVVVHDGAEALDYLYYRGAFQMRTGDNPAVMLLDLKLPLVDGLEVLKQIKSDEKLRMIPVVVLTSSKEVTAMSISAQYFAGTAVGAALGGWAGTYFPGNVFVFGGCVLVIGIFLTPFRVERSAYRYATITLATVMLVPSHSGWVTALHRFFEVSVGIAVGLTISAIRPERCVE